MFYSGFCDKQNRNYSVEFERISTSDLEKESFETGRLRCQYAALTGCCRNPKQCSILKELSK
jgi:hypothetical protein